MFARIQLLCVIATIGNISALAIAGSPKDSGLALEAYDLGIEHLEKNLWDEAIRFFDNAIKLAPTYPAALEGRGIAKSRKGDQDGAIRDYDEAIKQMPTRSQIYLNRSEAFRLKNDFARAMNDCNAAIKLDPGVAHYFIERGRIWSNQGIWDKAFGDFDEAIRLDSQSELAYFYRGMAWYDRAEYDRAIGDFDETIKLNPKNVVAYVHRGNSWVLKGEWDKGFIDFSNALKLDPRNPTALGNRAGVWLIKGEYAKAHAEYSKSLELDPSCADSLTGRALLMAACPEAKYRDGKRAIEDARLSCELTQWKFPVWMSTLASAYAEIGQFEVAVKWQKKALEGLTIENESMIVEGKKRLAIFQQKKPYRLTSSNESQCDLSRALSWFRKGQIDNAIAACDSAIRLNPKYSVAYSQRAAFWFLKGEIDKGIVDCNKALELDPHDQKALVNRGLAWMSKGEWEKSQFDLCKAIEFDPDESIALAHLSQLQSSCPVAKYRDGKIALVNARRACELTRWSDARSISNLASAYAESGQFDKAVKWQQVAMGILKTEKQCDNFDGTKRLKLFEQRKPYRLLTLLNEH